MRQECARGALSHTQPRQDFLGAGGRLPKARRGRVFIAQFIITTQLRQEKNSVVLTQLFMGGAADFALVDLSRIPNGIFFREVNPGSEMASQNDQDKAK